MLSLLLSSLFLLTACGGETAATPAPAEDGDTIHILTTTYPVYLFTTAVTEGVEGVEVTRLIREEISCLHDYTLTVNDMKAIEAADVIVMNGVGLEDFMADALATSDAPVIDCSEGVELLPALGHEGHDHETEYDPHIWMDPERAAQMVWNVATVLSEVDTMNGDLYTANASAAEAQLQSEVAGVEDPDVLAGLITFHDGFQYFAQATGLDLLKAIEEEEGAEASAAEIKEIVDLIGEYDIPAIFTEKNGSDATAQAISRETGCGVAQLDLVMSGDGSGIQPYVDAMNQNIDTILEALG